MSWNVFLGTEKSKKLVILSQITIIFALKVQFRAPYGNQKVNMIVLTKFFKLRKDTTMYSNLDW